ncbi:response regulator FixJ [Aurantimonas endophytica]|uniref:Two-component system response regulator FixJ n=1 Tax=Aurantimonas endophytica TaxID=1522175 RepID=A0A7W6HDC6_9HYPH|nr:response regulator FixJ [Aurantimonas endophytica]MBB4003129.1 two-component system response regulator FixJ [Aurantimonas endophytica]MCO6404000.1 response regulator [Aurantimonas endophytica]
MESGSYTVHIVDDEESVRKSLAFLLTMCGFTVRVHASATAFLTVAPTLEKGCLVTDLRMPDMSGVELLRRLSEAQALMPAIVVTGHGDVPMAVEAMKAGALDFIEKPFEEDVLVAAVRKAATELLARPDKAHSVPAIHARLEQLTERERQVLSGVVAGLANKTIAFDLDISPRTVEVHRANIMTKMQAGSLAELVRMALLAELEPQAAATRSPRI